MSYLNY